MRVQVLHVPDCPNLALLLERLDKVLGDGEAVTTHPIETDEQATALGMAGSPTLLLDGVDPFDNPQQQPGLSCRVYRDEEGCTIAAPSVTQLRTVLVAAQAATNLSSWRSRAAPTEPAERAVHQAVLRAFAATGRPPGAEELDEVAASFDTSSRRVLSALHTADAIRLDPAGHIAVAYPFSTTPTRHVVRIANRIDVYAMCAIDALGVAAMLAADVVISSTDPTGGLPITVTVTGGRAVWEPTDTVVFVGAQAGGGPSVDRCCDYLNFFPSIAAARAWATTNPNVPGQILNPGDAAQLGARIFGHLLTPGQDPRGDVRAWSW